jgi:hypothetical protein
MTLRTCVAIAALLATNVIFAAGMDKNPNVSKAEAREFAKVTLETMEKFWSLSKLACTSGTDDVLSRIYITSLAAALYMDDEETGRSAFLPYRSCSLAAMAVAGRMEVCYGSAGKEYEQTWRNLWRVSRAECRSAITRDK